MSEATPVHSGLADAPRFEHPSGRLLVVTPCRNEAEYARRTLDSMVAQTCRPDLWVIVDDGSTDETPAILKEYAALHPWIRVVPRADRGKRSVGPGVIEAFYAGYGSVDHSRFEFVCKLDLDLDLPPRYFERLFEHFDAEPRLGTFSGKPYQRNARGELEPELSGDEMSVGMTKLYRRTCFEAIGGFAREVMWDGIDCHTCRQKGWLAGSLDEPDLRFEHLRVMGSSDKGVLRGRRRHGRGQWYMGTSPLFMLASAIRRMKEPPRILGGLAMFWGYLSSALRGRPRHGDKAFRRFVRKFQYRALVAGKRRALLEINRAIAAGPPPEVGGPSDGAPTAGQGVGGDVPLKGAGSTP